LILLLANQSEFTSRNYFFHVGSAAVSDSHQ